MKNFLPEKKCRVNANGMHDHYLMDVTAPIVQCRCGKVTINQRKRTPMKKWRIDFTLERFGDMIIEAETREEAKKIFDKKAKERITFVHKHTYDWDVKINWATEEEDKPPFGFYQRKPSEIKQSDKLRKMGSKLFSPLYSEMTDPLVSYLPNTVKDDMQRMPWHVDL